MINLFLLLFIFILLVTQKILLLNEESLILLCFITFVILSLNNLNSSISTSFQIQSIQIKEKLIFSLKILLNKLKEFSILNKNIKIILLKFKEFKTYYVTFIILLGNSLFNSTKYHLILTYNKKFNFINKIEQQTLKLLIFIFIKKLSSIIKIKYFYNTSSLKIVQFSTLSTILLRECIQLISIEQK